MVEGQKLDPDKRRIKIILKVLENKGTLRFSEISDLYVGLSAPPNAFREDIKQISMLLENAAKLLEPLGFPVPQIVINGGGQISIPVRFFAELLHPEKISEKQKLSVALIEEKHNNEFLIPRTGSVYLGIGATMYELTKKIIEKRAEFSNNFHVYTQNLELATLLNFAAPKDTSFGQFTLGFPGMKVDFYSGCLVECPDPSFIDTAVLGVHTLDKDGKLYTNSRDTTQTTQRYLSIARRIVVFATNSALKNANGEALNLPNKKQVFFVTDKDFPDGYCPPGAEHVRLDTTPLQ